MRMSEKELLRHLHSTLQSIGPHDLRMRFCADVLMLFSQCENIPTIARSYDVMEMDIENIIRAQILGLLP